MSSLELSNGAVENNDDFRLHLSSMQTELKRETNKKFPFLYSLCCAVDGEGESSLLTRINNAPCDENHIIAGIENEDYGYSDVIVVKVDETLPPDYEYIIDKDHFPKNISTIIAVKKADASTTRYLTHLAIVTRDAKDIVPPEFSMIQTTPAGHSANLNSNKGKSMYVCTRYAKKGLRITSIGMVSTKVREDDAESFRLIHTVGGVDAILGEKTPDSYYLTYTKNWEALVTTPHSLVQGIQSTQQAEMPEALPDSNSMEFSLDAIPDAPDINTNINTSGKELIPTEPLVESEISLSNEEMRLEPEVLKAYTAKFNTTIRALLPLLVACHSNDRKLVKIALEHLYHFIQFNPVQMMNGLEDPLVDHLLASIYDGVLACFPVCCCNLANLLIKIADSFQHIPSTTMCIILSYIAALQLELFGMEDMNQQTSSNYTQVSINISIFTSLMKSRVQIADNANIEPVYTLALQEKLAAFAYKLESSGMMDMDVLLEEMKAVSQIVSPNDNHQNYIMFLLLLLRQVRRYGRSFSFKLLQDVLSDEKIEFARSPRIFYVYRFVVVPVLLLSLSVSEILDTKVLRHVLDLFRILWINYRESLITELGIVLKFLENLLQSDGIQTPNKLEIVRFFNNLFSTTEYLVDAFVNYDNKENIMNPVIELIDWCGDFVSQFSDGRQPTADESRLATESAELLKVIVRQVVNLSSTVESKDTKESPIEEETDLYRSARVRVPSSVNVNNELYGSAISPYGQSVMKEAISIVKEKGVKKCIAKLVAQGVIKRTADSIVQFILMNLSQLDETELGDYLGSDGGTTEEEIELMNQIRYRFVRGTNWKGMDVDIAIRHFLTRCGFRLPGEAQKIDRFVEAFSQCFWEDNPSFFTNSDVVFILTFSVIMLNSDAHNDNIRKADKMTLDGFLRNNRGIDNGKDLDRNMMTKLYWSIVNNEIKMPNQNEKRVVIELPPNEKEHNALLASTQSHLALLKEYRASTESFEKLRSGDIVETMWRFIWLECDIYLDTVLVKGKMRELLLEQTLDILRFCLMSSWILQLDAPDIAFSEVLKRTINSLVGQEFKQEGMKEFEYIQNEKDYVLRIVHLDRLIATLKDSFTLDMDEKKVDDKMELFVRGSIPPKEGRRFIYDGMLTKRTRRGKIRTYRFFLFSDILVYAKRTFFHEYKPHLIVNLEDCSLMEIDESNDPNALCIHTNIKRIFILFKDAREKKQWSRLLFNAILTRIKQQRAKDMANNKEGGRKYRTSSVYAALQNTDVNAQETTIKVSSEMSGLPENLQAALNTAKELISTVSYQEADRMILLHALYLRILYGKDENCPKDVQERVTVPVLKKWKELNDMGREKLYINFVVELASQNI